MKNHLSYYFLLSNLIIPKECLLFFYIYTNSLHFALLLYITAVIHFKTESAFTKIFVTNYIFFKKTNELHGIFSHFVFLLAGILTYCWHVIYLF